jgi:hypothetical protein
VDTANDATTTDCCVTKVPSFKSIGSDSESHNDWAALTHVPPSGTTVASLTDIRSDFDWLNGSTNHTGSLRWVISTPAGNIDAYYGSLPNFTDNGGPGSSDNLIAQTDARFDPAGRRVGQDLERHRRHLRHPARSQRLPRGGRR